MVRRLSTAGGAEIIFVDANAGGELDATLEWGFKEVSLFSVGSDPRA